MEDNEVITVDCRKCQHYYITWDPKFPYGCRALAFKAKQNPCNEVVKESQMGCQFFKEKTTSS